MASPRTPKRFRIFLDASVLFAAALSSRGRAHDLLLTGLQGEVELVVSSFILEECERNLARKAPEALPRFALFRRLLTDVVEATPELILEVARTIELKDAPVVAGAIAGNVDILATFDRRHLLSLNIEIERQFTIKVLTPDDTLAAI